MKIIVVSGASGGHIFPAISFIQAVQACPGVHSMLLVLPERSRGRYTLPAGLAVRYVPVDNISASFAFKNLVVLWGYIRSIGIAILVLSRFKPDVVIGFGSLVSFVFVGFAWLFRVRTLIHEQNVIPGRANRVLAFVVDKVALSFCESAAYMHTQAKKIIVTGNPIRLELQPVRRPEARAFFHFKNEAPVLLIVGGSQGSRAINTAVCRAIRDIVAQTPVQVIHITGKEDYESCSRLYKDTGLSAVVYSFFDKMHYAYSAADVILCRAGATTIAELARFKVPALFVPYPFAYRHQEANARIVERAGAGIIIDEHALSHKLKPLLVALLRDRQKRDEMRIKYNSVSVPDAGARLAQEALA